jgi:hypothetical protein
MQQVRFDCMRRQQRKNLRLRRIREFRQWAIQA